MLLIQHARKEKIAEEAIETLRAAMGISKKTLESNEELKRALAKAAEDADLVRLLDRTDREGIIIYRKKESNERWTRSRKSL